MSQFDFSHLKQLEVAPARLVDFTLYQVEGQPALHVVSASESNKPFFNEMLRRVRRNQRSASTVSSATVDRAREEDRELYARHVIRGWSGITDAQGQEVPFSVEAALGFLRQLPGWLFDDLRQFCSNPANFLDEGVITAGETGKA